MLVVSCRQPPAPAEATSSYKHTIDSLIIKGRRSQNKHIDSLLVISAQLSNIAARGDKSALVYSELFKSQYYWLSSDHEKSMELVLKCLADAEKWDVKEIYPDIYITMGNLHKESANYKMAFEASDKGLNWAQANKDTSAIIAVLALKAMFTHSFWLYNHDKTQTDSSINLQFAALKIAESGQKYERMRTRFYDNIAQYYLDHKDYKQAIFYGDKGVAMALKYNQQRSLTYSYCWLGQAWYFSGDKQKGLDYLNKSLILSKNLKEPYRVMEIYGHMYDCYYSAADYKAAIDMQAKSEHVKDSIRGSINVKQISELQIKYESAKKDQAISLLGHNDTVKNRLIIAVLGCSMLFIAFSVILFLQYRVISRNNHIITQSNEKKHKALQNIAHIQAHELRKPLASIMGLVNVIKISEYEFDKELITKLEESAKELDEKIHAVLYQVDKETH
ncbi:hypothetical protein KXQ82_07735 [Mucilaginibacter sp. HMF5004]|uniref:tetratricopeptide repeat protein n=1 Tax=Mucilaginibacter rivuli TaxID=2857527 RepID=UPI001C5FC9C4|nr:hypothetical protein [Mucilaginibacter rivuli]MBW4889601.1 hypothetical protein [Mucilaginibacter rivuli]